MAVTRNAWLRYKVIDRCLGNSGRKYTFNDLKEEIDEALIELDPDYEGISVRQLRKDLQFLQSDAGYNAPIELIIDGRQRYYRYTERFSIHQNPLNETEYRQLQQAISTLRNFEGRQEFEWLNELGPQLDDKLGAKSHKPIIGYETNIDYSGSIHIPELFNAILNKRVLSLVYKPFKGEPILVTCHPYYLKQYNGRWFLFGRNEELDHNQWNFPLDRIHEFNELDKVYWPDTTDWEEYFFDIIGVTRKTGDPVEVRIEIEANAVPYVMTKPLHPTQRDSESEEGKIILRINVIPNFELETLILSLGENVRVIEPIDLADRIRDRIRMIHSKLD
jgi:predicted DNA-binding transcriptional regulator YafY